MLTPILPLLRTFVLFVFVELCRTSRRVQVSVCRFIYCDDDDDDDDDDDG